MLNVGLEELLSEYLTGLISFEGPMGSSKTSAAAAIAFEKKRLFGRKVISNAHLNFDYTRFDIQYFLNHIADGEIENCVMLLDEFYQIADARASATKLNRLWTYFIVQARKRDVDILICTHYLDHIDKRNRRAVNIRGACRMHERFPCAKCKGTGRFPAQGEVIKRISYLRYEGHDACPECLGYGKLGLSRVSFLDRRRRIRYPVEIPLNYYWHLFNTRERVGMPQKVLTGIDTVEV